MKQYLIAVQHNYGPARPGDPDADALRGEVGKVNDEMRAAGAWVFGGGLLPPETATVLRAQAGATTMTDGPFAETKEQLGGFWVLRCADLDEALTWARKCAEACLEPVEVRPFEDEPDN